MKTNVYYTDDYAFDKDGEQHFVTLCAVVEEKKVWVDKEDIVKLEHGKPHSFLDATLKYKKKEFLRTLRMGYSICHNLDEIDEEYGKKLAFKRAMERPLGIIQTNNITMLQREDVEALLDSKVCYITDNIDKFIEKKK